jgi:tetratricopeptide (TPR) repeat protein
MDKAQFIAAVREHVTKAETAQALELALDWLAAPSATTADQSWLDTVRSLNAKFQRTRREQQRSIISYAQAQLNLNQINHVLLEAMEGLENDQPAPAETPDPRMVTGGSSRRTWLYAALGVTILALIGYFATQYLAPAPEGPDDPGLVDGQLGTAATDRCPVFEETSVFNILLLPFQVVRGEDLNIHTTLQLRLAEYSDRYRIPASVQVRNIDPNDTNTYPANGRQAERVGRPCAASMVIWGRTIEELDGSNLVYTSYHLVDKDYFTLTDFELNEEAQLDTLTSLSSIITDGTLTQDIEQALLMIFGMVAHETQHYAAAVEVFEDLSESEDMARTNPQISILLADSYLRLERSEQALPVLNDLIAQDETNLEAVTMRSNILFQQGQYAAAVADLDQAIEADPDNSNLRAKRAAANIRSSRLDLAKEDLDYVQRSDANQRVIRRINQEYQQKESAEEERLQNAEDRIQRNPQDTSALRIQAEAARNLGKYEVSNLAATNLLQMDPRSAIGLATLLEIKPQLTDTQAVNQVIEAAQQRITNEELIKASPRLRNANQIRNFQIKQ